MPIPKKKLKEARQPLRDRILKFLARNPEMAYSVLEIVQAVEGYEKDDFVVMIGRMDDFAVDELVGPVLQELEALLREGKITSAVYQANEYYAIELPA
ncbi:MAG: hypothetical protein ACREIU_07440 [Planctomycetota bacterium]